MSDYTSNLTRQRVAYDPGYAGSLALVPPLASKETALTGGEPPYGLDVGGDDATRDAARDWALRHGYMQAVGLAPCAHGLYLMRSCPGRDCYRAAGLDHPDLGARRCGRAPVHPDPIRTCARSPTGCGPTRRPTG